MIAWKRVLFTKKWSLLVNTHAHLYSTETSGDFHGFFNIISFVLLICALHNLIVYSFLQNTWLHRHVVFAYVFTGLNLISTLLTIFFFFFFTSFTYFTSKLGDLLLFNNTFLLLKINYILSFGKPNTILSILLCVTYDYVISSLLLSYV